jgi:hypothetical protein
MLEEFRITAIAPHLPDRVWIHTNLAFATAIADQAVKSLPYAFAFVVNTYLGDVSDPIYTARRRFNPETLIALGCTPKHRAQGKIDASWVLFLVNSGYEVRYSESAGFKRETIDYLVKDEMLAITDDRVDFSATFLEFMISREEKSK